MKNYPGFDAGIPVALAVDISEIEEELIAIRGFLQKRIAAAANAGEKATPELQIQLDRELANELRNHSGFSKQDVLRINYELTEFCVYITDPEGRKYRIE
ncbi:MAG: hypothetical protein Q7S50_01810 [bacterium]|nr:hypothetical protein [bacterium]